MIRATRTGAARVDPPRQAPGDCRADRVVPGLRRQDGERELPAAQHLDLEDDRQVDQRDPHDGPCRDEQCLIRPRPPPDQGDGRENQRQAHQHDEVEVLRRPHTGVRGTCARMDRQRGSFAVSDRKYTAIGAEKAATVTPAPMSGSGNLRSRRNRATPKAPTMV